MFKIYLKIEIKKVFKKNKQTNKTFYVLGICHLDDNQCH